MQEHGGIALQLGLEAPGGVLLGIVLALIGRRAIAFTIGALGHNLLEFVFTFRVWILAEWLKLSAVPCVVAYAMTIARTSGLTMPPRMRVHSYAIWDSVTFLLDVLAFLLMGMQARTIIAGMSVERLSEAARFAVPAVVTVIGVRVPWSIGADAFMMLQEELDRKELSLANEDERHIEEG